VVLFGGSVEAWPSNNKKMIKKIDMKFQTWKEII